MGAYMLFGTKKDRVTEEEYCLTILLHYLETHNEVDEYSCYPAYFKEELKLGDIKGSLNKLIKKGYISRNDNDKFFSYRNENATTLRHSAVLKLG